MVSRKLTACWGLLKWLPKWTTLPSKNNSSLFNPTPVGQGGTTGDIYLTLGVPAYQWPLMKVLGTLRPGCCLVVALRCGWRAKGCLERGCLTVGTPVWMAGGGHPPVHHQSAQGTCKWPASQDSYSGHLGGPPHYEGGATARPELWKDTMPGGGLLG